METHFMRQSYGNAIVQRPFPNGDSVDLELIIESIRDRLETIGGPITKFVVLMDREGRPQSAADIAQTVLDRLKAHSPARSFYVGVSDREVENWIIADEERMREAYGTSAYEYAGEGKNGKAILEQLNGGIDASFRDKATLLNSCSSVRAATKSPSLAHFLAQIDFQWHWASA
jgi:hypothetical protein